MKGYIENRVMSIAGYIIETGDTVRGAAEQFAISKSTVHKDVTERIEELDALVAREVRKVLDRNMDERHIRGGEATRLKYARDKV